MTIRYGLSNSVERTFHPDYTVGQLLSDRSILVALSAPEGCAAVSGGVTLDTTDKVSSYGIITLEKQASTKN